jgi:hypothetical protein
MVNKSSTILTSPPTKEQLAKQEKAQKQRNDDYELVRMLCDCWYGSLNDKSISQTKAEKEIIDMMQCNISCKKVTEDVGWKLVGEYIIKCRNVPHDGGRGNGVPSAFVKLLRDSAGRLPNPKTLNSAGDRTIYERHSARLAEYGVKVSPSTLRRWFEKYPP